MIPSSPHDLGLPFGAWRSGQREQVELICKGFEQSKYVILQAPTGSGKSIIAMAVHKAISKRTYVCVSTKQLQDQYLRDFKFAKTVKGRSNFECLINLELTANECQFEMSEGSPKKCEEYYRCPYFVQRDEALNAEVAIHNYAYFLRATNYSTLWKDADLLIIDEADTAENHVVDFVAPKFSDRDFELMNVEFPKPTADILLDTLRTGMVYVEQQIANLRDTFFDVGKLTASEARQFQRLSTLQGKIESILQNVNQSWIVVLRENKHKAIELRPVWVSGYSHFLLDHGNRVLMMSATIGKPAGFATLLGVDKYEYFELPSTFPIENRPFVVKPIANMSFSKIQESLPVVLKFVDEFIEEHKNEKGIIHTGNYRIAKYITENTTHPYYWFARHDDTEERASALDTFINSPPPKVLVSPSFERGVDLPYELCEWQLIVKVPYPSLGDPVVQTRLRERPEWYNMAAIQRLVQSYGRGVRAADDYALTIITDSGYGYLYHRAKDLMPSWFLEAHVWEKQ